MSEKKSAEPTSKPSYDDEKLVEVKQKANYAQSNCVVADQGDDFFPKQYFANPFEKKWGNKYSIEKFFPENWKPNSEYEKRLLQTADDLLGGTNKKISKEAMQEVLSGINPLHPFLEVGGALRTQVPLPMDMKELFSLFNVILNHNPLNDDKWKMPEDGFKRAAETIPTAIAAEEGQSEMLWKGTNNAQQIERNILIWDDVAGSAGINQVRAAPNFTKLLGSIIFQRSDEIAYNARGRYGAHVVRRLIDGHAYPNNDKSRTVIAFAYDRISGFPYGYYAGLLSHSDVDITKFVKTNNVTAKVTCPSLLLNYTFCMDQPLDKFSKTTSLMTSHLLAYISKYVTGLGPEKHLLAIHTDKSAASKSTQKMMQAATSELAYETNDAVARTIFQTINRGAGKSAFTYLFPAPDFPGLVRVDQSTVPLMDAGEEVPEPCDRFYQGIFANYRLLVEKYSQKKIGPLRNGNLNLENNFSGNGIFLPSPDAEKTISHLAKENNFYLICKQNHLDPKQVIEWLQAEGSLNIRLLGKLRNSSVLAKDYTISSLFPLNFGCRPDALNTTLKETPEALRGGKNEVAQRALFECIRFWAKFGNTANQYHPYKPNMEKREPDLGAPMRYVPRLTDMGFIIVGSMATFGSICHAAREKASQYPDQYTLGALKNSPLDMITSNKKNDLKAQLKGNLSDCNFSQLASRVMTILNPVQEVTGASALDSINEIIAYFESSNNKGQ